MKRLTRSMLLALVAATLLCGGCFKTSILNGGAAGAPSPGYADRWYHNAVYGLVDLSGPVMLNQVCPSGWASIHVETGFLNSLVSGILFNLYNPQTVTITCKSGAAFNAIRNGDGRIVHAELVTVPEAQASPTR